MRARLGKRFVSRGGGAVERAYVVVLDVEGSDHLAAQMIGTISSDPESDWFVK